MSTCHVCGKKKAAGNIVVGRVMSEFSQSSYLYVPCARGPLCVFWRLLARTPGAMEDMARAREAWSRLAHLGRGDIDAGMFRRTKVCAQERSPIPVSEMVVAGAECLCRPRCWRWASHHLIFAPPKSEKAVRSRLLCLRFCHSGLAIQRERDGICDLIMGLYICFCH